MSDEQDAWSRVGPQVMFGMDADGVCTMSVGPGLAALGFADGELVGTSVLELYRDDPVILTSVRRALAGETFTATRVVAGRTLWVYYQALVDPAGTFTGSLAVTTDVTEQLADAARAGESRRRAAALAELSRALGDSELGPEDVLGAGVRIITEALAEAAVAWMIADDGRETERVEPHSVWHADEAVRRRLDDGLADSAGSAWRDPAALRALTGPVGFARDQPTHPRRDSAASRVIDELGLDFGLRMPLRSRGRTIGSVDFVRGSDRGAFGADDQEFAQEVADRFTLAYDNALLLAEQRAVLRTLLKFQSLADSSDDLIAIADGDGQATYLNPRLRGVGLELRDDDIWASVTGYFGADTTAQMRAALDAGERWRGDVALPGGDDGQDDGQNGGQNGGRQLLVHTEAFALAYPDTGEPLGFAWIAQDVTRLRATEQRLRAANAEIVKFQALVEASHDFIAIAALDGRVTYLNPGGRALVGLAPDADVTQTSIADYLTPEGLEQSLAVEQPAVRDQGSWEGESTLRHFGGRAPVPVTIESFLMHDLDTGEPFGLATVQRDVTERVAAEHAVRRLSEHRQALLVRLVQAQEAERTKIAGDVHDDPVQALAAVDLRLGLLRRRIVGEAPQLLDVVGPLQETVARANERLRALLFDLEAPDLAHGLAPALERAAQELFRDADVRVEVRADDEPPADDSLRTVAYRIAREALINARKHARARRVRVTVGGDDGLLEVEVADDGVGLGPGPLRSAPGHYGFNGMRDRASVAGGEVLLGDGPEGGAVVTVRLPGASRA